MLKSLGISEAQIENGQLRVDVNISVQGEKYESPRVEIKNVAGSKNVERAVEYEYRRHIDMLTRGEKVLPETRRYEADMDRTVTLRIKDEEPDYRFF
jgi:aspartyl-tRNA(Asn)/glutamyl-tRNA(Gln) amidotransferase subunit B